MVFAGMYVVRFKVNSDRRRFAKHASRCSLESNLPAGCGQRNAVRRKHVATVSERLMTQLTCQCGESFQLEMPSGLPRNRCPYCRAPLGHDLRSAESFPSEKPVELKPWSDSPTDTQPNRPEPQQEPKQQTILRPLVPDARKSVIGHSGIAELLDHVEPLMRRHEGPLLCPQQSGCDVPTCARAFACNALPSKGCRLRNAVLIGLVCAGGSVAFFVILFAFLLAFEEGQQNGDTHWGLVILFLAGLMTAAFLIGYLISSWNTRKRVRYQRALAAAANELSMAHLSGTQLADAVGCEALPLYLPGRLDTFHLQLAGEVDGLNVIVLDFICTFGLYSLNPAIDATLGNIAFVANRGDKNEIWRRHLAVVMTECCPGIPDFCLTPWRDRSERVWQKHHLRWPKAETWNKAFHRRYYFVSPDPAVAALFFTPEWQELLMRGSPRNIQVVSGHLYLFLSRGESWFPDHSEEARELSTTIEIATKLHKHFLRFSLGRLGDHENA